MVNAISPVKVSSGLCPHGMPFGACPICSGKSAGGGNTTTTSSSSQSKANEMSWDECYAIGQMLKAQKQRATDNIQFQHLQNELNTQNKLLEALNNRIVEFVSAIRTNIVSPITQNVQKAFNIVQNTFSQLQQNLVQSPMIQRLHAFSEKVKHLFINISDKLAAIFGEPLAAAEKFISENWKKLKKLFAFAKVDTEMEQGSDEEDSKEFKRWLKIKPFKLFKKNLDNTLSIWKKGQLIAKLIINADRN